MPASEGFHFTKEHIEKHRFNASSVLAEQAVHCLELVAELAEYGLSFQFKGGNSLLLILDKPARFSIDVDVTSDRPREEIEAALDGIVAKYGVFTRWGRREHKTKPWLPLSSYYMYYNSVFEPSPDTNIMFDVQMRRCDYATEFKEVCCGSLYKSAAKVELPLKSSIASDKLLTLGPNTLGIPVGRGKGGHRLKHVYDVSRLSSTLPDVAKMRVSLDQCLKQENDLQGTGYSVMDIVKDTLALLFMTARHDTMPESSDIPILDETIKGLNEFAGHLFESGYDWQRLRLDMAKSAVCMSAVGKDGVTDDMMKKALVSDAPANFEGSLGIKTPHIAYLWEAVYEWWGKDAFWM